MYHLYNMVEVKLNIYLERGRFLFPKEHIRLFVLLQYNLNNCRQNLTSCRNFTQEST